MKFILNDREITTNEPAGLPVLDFIRYNQQLFGTKIGCREGDCGACTILVGELINGKVQYTSATSCLMPLGNVAGKHIVSIEGINMEQLNPMQQAMSDEGATQCGFCTPGFVVSFAGFSLSPKTPDYDNAIASINGNICRCTGYKSIERAAARLTELMKDRKDEEPVDFAVSRSMLPGYFSTIAARLAAIHAGTEAQVSNGVRFLAGGTDLYVQQHEELIQADIHFLYDRKDLKGIEAHGDQCILGGGTTVTDILESPVFINLFPRLEQFLKLVSSTPIRNMATIAGNFVNASPIGDMTIMFLALDAELVLVNGEIRRKLPLRKFYKGYKVLDKLPGEYIEKLSFKLPPSGSYFNFEKVSKRTHLDIASVNTAIYLECNENCIISSSLSAGGVGPTPLYLEKTSLFLKGKEINDTNIESAILLAQGEISPISDARGSEEYKRLLLAQLIKAHFYVLAGIHHT